MSRCVGICACVRVCVCLLSTGSSLPKLKENEKKKKNPKVGNFQKMEVILILNGVHVRFGAVAEPNGEQRNSILCK